MFQHKVENGKVSQIIEFPPFQLEYIIYDMNRETANIFLHLGHYNTQRSMVLVYLTNHAVDKSSKLINHLNYTRSFA